MENSPRKNSKPNVAVVGVGYWGKNLVSNFHSLGALAALCDKRGRQRRESTPAISLARPPIPGMAPTELASLGVILARCAHQWIRPIE